VYGARPVVAIFARELTDDLASLVKQVDMTVTQNQDKQMAAFLVVLTDDADQAASKLEAMAREHGIQNVPLTVFENATGPPDYKIAKDADVTVLAWRNLQVEANQAVKKGELDESARKKIVADANSILK
jgi:hypothetical protein